MPVITFKTILTAIFIILIAIASVLIISKIFSKTNNKLKDNINKQIEDLKK